MGSILQSLVIPADFGKYDTADADTIRRLDAWKRDVCLPALAALQAHVRPPDQRAEPLSVAETTDVVAAAAPFDGAGEWVSTEARGLAQDILRALPRPNGALIEHVLAQHVKPLFRANPHPRLSAASGRALPRAAGGPLGAQDFYEGQTWKSHPGAAAVLSWCVRHCQVADYERLWHLVVPPVMTLLDDYEAAYKLQGVALVHEMLQGIPPELLRRTGVDSLLHSSLASALTCLRDPRTPELIRSAVRTALVLVERTTQPGSSQRFDRLCALLGDGIIDTVWAYASLDAPTIKATLDVTPDILKALGVGSARYLRTIIPQLVHPLLAFSGNFQDVPDNNLQENMAMQLSALRALGVVIDICAGRMQHWRGTIAEGVGKCWVTIVESEVGKQAPKDSDIVRLRAGVQAALRDVCLRLAEACPTVVEVEFARLLRLDPMLHDLANVSDIKQPGRATVNSERSPQQG